MPAPSSSTKESPAPSKEVAVETSSAPSPGNPPPVLTANAESGTPPSPSGSPGAGELESSEGNEESGIEDPFKANPKLANADETLKKFSKNLNDATGEMATLYDQVLGQMKSYQDAMRFLANNVQTLQ